MASEAYDDLGDEFEEIDELPEGAADEPVSAEERAMAMGWKPRHQYRGPPDGWTDAETFIARGETELPILRDQNRRMSERLARVEPEMQTMRASIAEQTQATRDALELARRADERGYQRAMTELKSKQRLAVQQGDETAYDQVEEEIAALETTRAQIAPAPPPAAPPPAAPPPAAAPTIDPAITAFINDNVSWFGDTARPELRQMMIALHTEVINERQIADVGEQMAEAKARLAERYPQHADLTGETMAPTPRPPQRRAALAAPRGAIPRPGPIRPGASPFELITDPAERKGAREAFARMQRADPGLTAGEYVALYNDPHADVLALRQTYRSKK